MIKDKPIYQYHDITIREFSKQDICKKVTWINDPLNNRYLHYDLPLTVEGTTKWYQSLIQRNNRYDAVVEYNGIPIGIVGLLNIDSTNLKAESYVTIGEQEYKHKGYGIKATKLILAYAFFNLGLNKVQATIEVGNIASVNRLYNCGGQIEGYLRQDKKRGDKFYDNYIVGYLKSQFVIPDEMYDSRK